MKLLTCAAVRRRLEAWHDRELAPAELCAVGQHLEGCPRCAGEARQLELVGRLLRDGSARRAPSADTTAHLRAGVLGRIRAENAIAWPRRISELFDDMHFVWAGLSASAATVACAVLLLGLVYFAAPGREDSLAGVMTALGEAPGSDRNPVRLDGRMMPPRVLATDAVPAALSASTEEDLVFALAAVVTQEGRVSQSELLLATRHDREVVLRLMNAVAESRLQPASVGGAPVAVNLVWLLTHTTVRGKSHS